MTTITRHLVLLQYPDAGQPGPYGECRITDREAKKFVALDRESGGYPYAVEIERAQDFKTEEEALKYRGHFKGFEVRHVKVTYSFDA